MGIVEGFIYEVCCKKFEFVKKVMGSSMGEVDDGENMEIRVRKMMKE